MVAPPERVRTADVELDAASSAWDGQHLNKHYAVSVLAARRYQAAG
jgi:hypothetical protein